MLSKCQQDERSINSFLSNPLHNPANQNVSLWSLISLDTSLPSSKFHQLSDISIESLKSIYEIYPFQSKWSVLLHLVFWIWIWFRPQLSDMRVYASGISMNPAAFKIVEKFYFEDLSTDSFRFEAGECENNWLLSYFISDGGAGALHTLDRARGQGHSGVSCHEQLTNGWCSSWHALLYFVRMMTSPFSDRPWVHCVHTRWSCSLLIVSSISSPSRH